MYAAYFPDTPIFAANNYLVDKLCLPYSLVDETDGLKSYKDLETDLSLSSASKAADRSLSPDSDRKRRCSGMKDVLNTKANSNSKYKTELCKNFGLYGRCKWAENCFFAHGKFELKSKTQVNNFYKTKICKHFHKGGHCPYASRCQYFHFKPFKIYAELLDSYENKLKCRISESNTDVARVISKVERMQPRLDVFKRFVRADVQKSLQEKFLASEF